MAYQNGEAGAGLATRSASECLSGQIDNSEITAPLFVLQAHKLTRRFGISAEVAALFVELSGLGLLQGGATHG